MQSLFEDILPKARAVETYVKVRWYFKGLASLNKLSIRQSLVWTQEKK